MATDISKLPYRAIPVLDPKSAGRVFGRVEVETNEYERSHFKAPRGRGGWMFLFPSTKVGGGAWVGSACGTYAEARSIASVYAKQIGAQIIVVLP